MPFRCGNGHYNENRVFTTTHTKDQHFHSLMDSQVLPKEMFLTAGEVGTKQIFYFQIKSNSENGTTFFWAAIKEHTVTYCINESLHAELFCPTELFIQETPYYQPKYTKP